MATDFWCTCKGFREANDIEDPPRLDTTCEAIFPGQWSCDICNGPATAADCGNPACVCQKCINGMFCTSCKQHFQEGEVTRKPGQQQGVYVMGQEPEWWCRACHEKNAAPADALKAMRPPTYFYACLAAGFLALLAAMAAFAIIVNLGGKN